MSRWMCENWSLVSLGTGCLLVLGSGCNTTELSGYRPVGEHSAAPISDKSQESPNSDLNVERPARLNDEMSAAVLSTGALSPNSMDLSPVSALVPVNVIDGANVRALMNVAAADSRSSVESDNSTSIEVNAVTVVSAKTTEIRKIEILVKEKTFRTEPKTGAARVSFDDLDLLKVLNMEPVVDNAFELMPEWLRGLDGKTIRIRGFMYPTYDTEGIEHFVLARDNQICCFGRDPKIYDLIQVDMKPGKTTNYIPATRAFDVIGKFRIEMMSQEGKPYGLYFIEQAETIDR